MSNDRGPAKTPLRTNEPSAPERKSLLAQNRLAKIPENLMRMAASLLNPAALLKLPLQILSQRCQS